MPILDIQRRGQQIGRLRLGEQVPVGTSGKTRPAKLTTFRFTTGSRHTADAIAALYGGTVKDWQNGEFEIYTNESAIGVTVPPRDQVVTQFYEWWTRGGASRRCDSQTEQIKGGPCQCPHAINTEDEDEVEAAALERARLAALNPPQACKLVTRISVMIPDLPGLGVFRLDTGSYYAAVEIGDAAAVMQIARDRGVFLPGILRIEQRQKVAGGKTTKFVVPVLEITSTFREIASGALQAGGITAQLPPAPGEKRLAIAGGPSPKPVQVNPTQASPAPSGSPMNAQELADRAAKATTVEEFDVLGRLAHDERWDEDQVTADGKTFEELRPLLNFYWEALQAKLAGHVGGAA